MKQVKNISLLLLASLFLAGCNNEDDRISPPENAEKVELGITAGVTLTKGAIDGGEQKDDTGGNLMASMAVYAKDKSGTSSYGDANKYALYSRSDATWTPTAVSGTTPHIYLTSDVATLYAYHPAYAPHATTKAMQTSGTALQMTGTLGTDAHIPVSVFEGGTGSTNALETHSTITVPSVYTLGAMFSAPGEVDYMWAEKSGSTDKFEASNGKGSGATPGPSVTLNMKHALSMVSFRVYNDGNYAKEGKLTQIKLANTSGSTALSKGTNPTMNIATGGITPGTAVGATYTRVIQTEGMRGPTPGHVVPKVLGSVDQTKEAAPVFSLLVLPDAATVAKNTIKATFTIDNDAFDVLLAADGTQGNKVQWEAGKNYTYTVKLSGHSLTLSSVTVEAWGTGANKDLDVN